ncbi:hypothetical protein BJF92_06510 [Rhizobium rhizosphaerae]|uniref:Lectin-like protein BA14k n=1 Tax=Xaviernesmea rhizosphaerae TaxID=1672749 RepID=A0A1Q9ANZ8_9HYPH|nr:BA14K family protein [Xaviernesmea rhizosphaerae]OLP57172.1 hypothetical protein BJF92_06510 [Xaviernesmea rhizosphaerae]OQP87721.1 BA14K family protein [Xaviernesmea rhizosphaerae]
MKQGIKALVLTVATAATVLPVTAAHADDWRYRHHRHGVSTGDAVAIGALGLATGLIVGGAVASQPQPVYQDRVYIDPPPPPPPVYRPSYTYVEESVPVYQQRTVVRTYGTLEPWSQSWYRYCADRYRSFDSRSGTYIGLDGRSHFCTAG